MKISLIPSLLGLLAGSLASVQAAMQRSDLSVTFQLPDNSMHMTRRAGGPQNVSSFSVNGAYQYAIDSNKHIWIYASGVWIDTFAQTQLTGTSIVGYATNTFALSRAGTGDMWIGTISIPAPLSVAVSFAQQGGSTITKVKANPAGSIWVSTTNNDLFRFEKVNTFTYDSSAGKISDFVVRDLVFAVKADGNVCSRITGDGPYTCTKPAGFTPKLVAVSSKLLYVLDTAGNLQTTSLPLSASSTWFKTGYSSPNAQMITVYQGETLPKVVTAAGAVDANVCASEAACTPPAVPAPYVYPARFAIQVRGTGFVIDQYAFSTAMGQQFYIWPASYNPNELFTRTANGQLLIQNGNLCMDLYGWSTTTNSKVAQWPCNSPATPNQQFDYQPANGWWTPRLAPSMCLTRGSGGGYGLLVIQPCDGANWAQRFDNVAK
ncbi:hypothetical protein HDU97_008806 [Phlyctochytrium planicorne]|nr:hypothetical protein HDU97_008806 [Phlyctochytrium planicorne]